MPPSRSRPASRPGPRPDRAAGRRRQRRRGEGMRRGVGFAVGYKNIAYSEGFDDSSEATVELFVGGGSAVATVRSAAAEVGQGLTTMFQQIVESELGVDDVRILPADTDVGSAGSSSASRQTMMTGGAVQAACREVRAELLRSGPTAARPGHRRGCRSRGRRSARRGARSSTSSTDLTPPIRATVTYRHRPVGPFDERGQGDIHVSFAFAAGARRGRGRRRARARTRRPDRGGAGRRAGDQPARS